MRKLALLGVLFLCLMAFACQKAPETGGAAVPAGGAAAPAPAPAAAADVSPEMQGFMDMLKGKSADVTAALQKYGVEALNKNDMDMYDLQTPTVVKTEKQGDSTVYTMEAKAGITTRTYGVTWAAGKITVIEDKGMR
jgi:hypothetical protein